MDEKWTLTECTVLIQMKSSGKVHAVITTWHV